MNLNIKSVIQANKQEYVITESGGVYPIDFRGSTWVLGEQIKIEFAKNTQDRERKMMIKMNLP